MNCVEKQMKICFKHADIYFFGYCSVNKYNGTQLVIDETTPNHYRYISFQFCLCCIFLEHIFLFCLMTKTYIIEKSLSHSTAHLSIIKKKILFANHLQSNEDILLPIFTAHARMLVNKGRFTAGHFRLSASQRCRQIVCSLRSILGIFFSCLREICVLNSAVQSSQRSPLLKVFLGLSSRRMLSINSQFLKCCRNLVIVDR